MTHVHIHSALKTYLLETEILSPEILYAPVLSTRSSCAPGLSTEVAVPHHYKYYYSNVILVIIRLQRVREHLNFRNENLVHLPTVTLYYSIAILVI